jgi:bacillolysin
VKTIAIFLMLTSLMLTASASQASADTPRPGVSVAAVTPEAADRWAARIDAETAAGTLRLVSSQADPDLPGRRHLRYDQRVDGVRVFGAQLVRQLDATGRTLTVLGRVLEDTPAPAPPALDAAAARAAAEAAYGAGAHVVGPQELVLLPLADRSPLAYMMHVRRGLDLDRCFVDAADGRVVFAYDDRQTAAAVGLGTGVWGDRKKMSVSNEQGAFRASDALRPPELTTYDFGFDVRALFRFLDTGFLPDTFVASDSDNDWSDGPVVDAHTYAGWTYDYYFKRHGRRGIDGFDLPVRSFTHFDANYANAFWDSSVSAMFYGDGGGRFVPFSGAIDVVAHELTHGVTAYTWEGIYYAESGALNEAFSDIMGTSVEFFYQPVGNDRLKADYWLGEDLSPVFDPPRNAFRSMDNPSQFCDRLGCDPDNYSRRFLGPEDNAGVHINSGIANHAFYLLIEGGRNRTSGLTVAGLGAANRERAEKIFYRGFTLHLTPTARFADARVATIQAALELYGPGREAEQTAAAWTAVGVQ